MRTDSPADTATSRDAPSPSHSANWRLRAAAGLTLVWIIALTVLSLLTANPVTLNREQVLRSADVLTAVVENLRTGEVRVVKAWRQRIDEPRLRIANLSATEAKPGEPYLIPVSRSDGTWIVTPTHLPNQLPLVYPQSAESERQLGDMLRGLTNPTQNR